MNFYCLDDNSLHKKGVPGLYGGHAESRVLSECRQCGARVNCPAGTIRMSIEPDKGTFWPDMLWTSGGFMGLYVSSRVKESFDCEGIRYGTAFAAQVQPPYPKKIKHVVPPDYFHMPGELGARLDFEVSGYKVNMACMACGANKTDPASQPTKYHFLPGTWNGSDIFYTDFSWATMFCTERILELARKHKWTNFRFVPIEEGHQYGHKGVDYLR